MPPFDSDYVKWQAQLTSCFMADENSCSLRLPDLSLSSTCINSAHETEKLAMTHSNYTVSAFPVTKQECIGATASTRG